MTVGFLNWILMDKKPSLNRSELPVQMNIPFLTIWDSNIRPLNKEIYENNYEYYII